jgi:hypothetical protein
MRYDGEWLHYFKFDVEVGVESGEDVKADVDALVKMLEKRKTPKQQQSTGFGGTHLMLLSDWQIGKNEGGGTERTVDRIVEAIDASVRRVKDLRKIGRGLVDGAIVGTGDLFEGTCGFYANQGYLIDCNRREQSRLVRRLIAYAIDEHAPLFDQLHVATVGGNHGENREGGKKVTDDADNDDVTAFECVKEAFDRAGHVDNLEWTIPDDELSILLELSGVPVGFTHGNLFSGGGKLAQAKALNWWQGQTFGLQPVAPAKILVSSHFHHYSCIDHGGRIHFQTPAMDGGSKWYRDMTGADSVPGMLTMTISDDVSMGFDDVAIL